MMEKCEICGATYNLTKVYMCGCDEESPSATLCKDCKKKYFDYICPKPGIFGVPDLMRLSYADNLVYAYNVRFVDYQEKKKEETNMQITYKGYSGELVKLEKTKCPPLNGAHIYDISIYDGENMCTHSFTNIKLEDVKFIGGVVSFNG